MESASGGQQESNEGDARAAEWLVKAGERAQRAYAWLTAADRYEGTRD